MLDQKKLYIGQIVEKKLLQRSTDCAISNTRTFQVFINHIVNIKCTSESKSLVQILIHPARSLRSGVFVHKSETRFLTAF